jgi:hypothetical protein
MRSVGTPNGAEEHFPGYDATAQAATWDEVTRRVVLRRLEPYGALSFFSPEEATCGRALLDRLLAQDREPRVPVIEVIDDRLARRAGDGYRYADMPEDGDAWRRSLVGLDGDAAAQHKRHFAELDWDIQGDLLETVRTTKGDWHGMPAGRVFSLWVRYACDAFYAHPLAWNEIGFGGPAYPRGYKALGIDKREPWEVPEHDAQDPIPWEQRVEAARRRHEGGRAR